MLSLPPLCFYCTMGRKTLPVKASSQILSSKLLSLVSTARTGSSGKLLVKQTFYCPSLEVKQGGKRNKAGKKQGGKKQGGKKQGGKKNKTGKITRREK